MKGSGKLKTITLLRIESDSVSLEEEKTRRAFSSSRRSTPPRPLDQGSLRAREYESTKQFKKRYSAAGRTVYIQRFAGKDTT